MSLYSEVRALRTIIWMNLDTHGAEELEFKYKRMNHHQTHAH